MCGCFGALAETIFLKLAMARRHRQHVRARALPDADRLEPAAFLQYSN